MQHSGLTLKLLALLAVAVLAVVLHLRVLSRQLERHQADVAVANRDLSSRKAGCEAALEDMAKFEKHLGAFMTDKEKEIARLKQQMEKTRRRIGNVQKIMQECEKLERELEEVQRVLSLVTGEAEGKR
jgi:uncharacterized protein HemX